MRTIRQLMNLEGRVALVTGAAGHIGRAMCDALAELGAQVAIVDRDEAGCAALAGRLRDAYQVDAFPLAVDLLDEAQLRRVVPAVLERFGRLDVLVNNAAFVGTDGLQGWATDFANQTAPAWRQAMELNLTAPFLLSQACAEPLARQRGAIVNVASIYGLVGPDLSLYEDTNMHNPAAYAASKGGLLQLTRWLATVLAPDVRVNAITPGGIERRQPDAFQQRYCRRTPLGRMGTEEDMKGALVFLASDLSAYVTGQNIVVDGGWTAW